MKKETIKTIATATAVVSATALTVNAKADSVTNNPTTENNDKVQTTVTPEQQLKNNVDTTKQALDSASQTQTQAQSKADEANSEVANNQTNVDQAQANVDKAQANQDQATQKLADLNKQNENYDSNLSNAKTNVDNAQTAVTNAQNNLEQAKANDQANADALAKTQAQVDEAQKNVTDTQNQINQNQSQQDNVKQQISNADSQISNIQNDYNNQNAQINNNEAQIVDNYQNQINNIQNNQVNDEKQNLNNQISDLNSQVQTLQDQQQTSSSQTDDNSKYTNVAGETVTPSEGTQKVLDKIDTNADYMSNLYRNGLIGDTTNDSHARTNGGKILSDTYGVDRDTDSGDDYSLEAGGDDLLTLNKTFDDMYQNGVINNKLNDVDPIKNGQLTTDQERELAIIAADKLNSTREKLGLSRWVMTEKDFELAQQRASQQSAINLQHNLDDINSVFGGVYGENLALAFLHEGDNFNDVMGYIDASIAQLIDSDKGSDYGHRYNIFNQDGHIALGIKQVSNDTIMITMDWFNSDDENGTDLLALPAQLKAQGPTKKATVVVDNSAKIAQLKSQIADLQAKLANVQFNYDKLSSSDKKNYDNLKSEIEVTHVKANNARNTLKQNSQASIDQVAQTKTGLYNKLYDLQDQMKTLQDKLVLQKTKLVQLQEELNNSKSDDNKSDDNKTLADLQAKLTQAQTNLDNANQALADLENLPERLAQAQANVQKAQADLTSTQAKLDEAKKVLAESQAQADVANGALSQANDDKSQAQVAYDKALKAYNDYLKAQQAVKDAEEKAKVQAQAKAEHTYFAKTNNGKVVDEKGHIMVGYSAHGNQVFDAQSKLVGTLAQTSTTRRMANTVKQENAKALPQTGEKQSKGTTVGAILVGLGSLLGLGALGKRKEK